MKKNILVVEDEERILEIITDYLIEANFNVFGAVNGEIGLEIFENEDIDLVLLDVMLPKIDGWSVCRRIRKKSHIPIIMLTAREDEDDKLMGFELGADEYVTKPFSPKVLVKRVETLIKRIDVKKTSEDDILSCSGIYIDTKAYLVKIDEKIVNLSPKEFDLLVYLIKNSGIVLSRELILDKVWGYDFYGDLRVVDSHIKKLRKKLDNYSKIIKTVIKVGYKFEE
ncbi:response regulator transcription factor [Helicovermis profundi]|uniref:Stage 0 sporulation protein A homolog n=1 Tax=Helicovermis profundi TaxID=3065157 RepID=A0AAU9E212_9FIRM|nr:response regulator transcription factor [Clostridia bacterium S502]